MSLSPSTRQNTGLFVTTSMTVVAVTLWKILQWRARQRATKVVRQLRDYMKEDGPLIDYNDPAVRERILNTAVKRASNWMALAQKHAKPMVGQVGGISRNKKPLLTLAPDYVLKPIIADHRGFREIAFYEAIRTLTQTKHVQQAYSAFLTGRDQNQKSSSSSSPASSSSHHSSQNSSTTGSVQNSFSVQFCTYYNTALQYLGERMDTIAMALAIFCQDSIVLEAEVAVKESWRGLKREVDMIRQLQKFSPKYYGVMNLSSDNDDDNVERRDLKSNIKINDDKNNSNDNDGTGPFLSTLTSTRIQSTTPFGLTEDAHLLLQDLTINFSKPCVMDLKMGVQTYEPDATPEKRAREYGKYPQQTQFGFRIVGMRFYDPGHVDADSKGFCYFQKPYGRALTTRDKLLQAFRLFFSACAEQQNGQTQQSPTKRLSQSRIENDVFSSNAMDGANINGDEQSESHKNDQDHIEQKPQQEQHHPLRPTSNSAAAAIRNRTISNLLVQLRPLRHWFEDNKSLCFYASSLLIVYEGDSDVNVDNMAMIKMIDFGRVRRQAGGDSGYCSGLSMLKSILTDLWQEEEEERIRGSTLKNRQLQQQLHEGE